MIRRPKQLLLLSPSRLQRRCRSSDAKSSEVYSGPLALYTRQLDRAPLTTKGLTSGFVAAAGDLLCQSTSTPDAEDLTSNNNTNATSFDWQRTGRFFIMGCFWVAPCTHYWYNTLNTRLVPGVATVLRVAQRVLLDQVLFAPIFCPSFMGFLWLLEGRHSTYEELEKDLMAVTPDVIRANWLVWIPANAINFSVVPLRFQVLFGNVVALCWNVFLSYTSQRPSQAP